MIRTARRALAAGLAVVVAASLAGCTQLAASAVDPDECAPAGLPGPASDAVDLHGRFGESLEPHVSAPVAAEALELTRSGSGSGPVATDAGILEGRFSILTLDDGAAILEDVPFAAAEDGALRPLTMQSIGAQLPGAAAALRCAQGGDRIVAAMPAAMLFGHDAVAAFSLDPQRTVAFAADVTRVYPSSASGRLLPPVDGIPAVVTAPDGRPGATMPQSAPPNELRTALRVDGFGREIAEGDALTLHVSIFDWTSGEEIASTWDDANTVMRATAGVQPDGLYGVTSDLVGEPSGSQLIAVVPTELALSQPGPIAPSVATGSTLVLVVDVLAADPAS